MYCKTTISAYFQCAFTYYTFYTFAMIFTNEIFITESLEHVSIAKSTVVIVQQSKIFRPLAVAKRSKCSGVGHVGSVLE